MAAGLAASYANGKTILDLAKEAGTSTSVMYQALKDAGTKFRPRVVRKRSPLTNTFGLDGCQVDLIHDQPEEPPAPGRRGSRAT
jgi:hypothetical protein